MTSPTPGAARSGLGVPSKARPPDENGATEPRPGFAPIDAAPTENSTGPDRAASIPHGSRRPRACGTPSTGAFPARPHRAPRRGSGRRRARPRHPQRLRGHRSGVTSPRGSSTARPATVLKPACVEVRDATGRGAGRRRRPGWRSSPSSAVGPPSGCSPSSSTRETAADEDVSGRRPQPLILCRDGQRGRRTARTADRRRTTARQARRFRPARRRACRAPGHRRRRVPEGRRRRRRRARRRRPARAAQRRARRRFRPGRPLPRVPASTWSVRP